MMLLDTQHHYSKDYWASISRKMAQKEKRSKNYKPQKCTGTLEE